MKYLELCFFSATDKIITVKLLRWAMAEYFNANGKTLLITGRSQLCGVCTVSSSKNAVLPILAASLLTDEPVTLCKIPDISDVRNMISLLKVFGAEVQYLGDSVTVSARTIKTTAPGENMAGRLRASFLFMGPLIAREGSVTMPLPGGCRIGNRPIDLHLKGFRALGARSVTTSGHVHAWGRLSGSNFKLDYPSVGATENIIMAASLANGTTLISGAAVEPEVLDLVSFLKKMGARITVEPGCVTIKGVRKLSGTVYTPIPDRIEAGTLMLAAAVCGGDVHLRRVNLAHLKPVSDKLLEAGAEVFPYNDELIIRGRPLRAMQIISSPFPGFPTDMQAPFMAACCSASGRSTVSETVFENRFLHVEQLKKMGAKIRVAGNTAIVLGSGGLHGAKVEATDLRAGAALCIAALLAGGETLISNVYHLERGYERFEEKLRSLGACIQRI